MRRRGEDLNIKGIRKYLPSHCLARWGRGEGVKKGRSRLVSPEYERLLGGKERGGEGEGKNLLLLEPVKEERRERVQWPYS